MNKACFAGLFFGLLFIPNPASADLVQLPAGAAAWTVDVTASQIPNAPAPAGKDHLVRLQFTQDDEKRRTVITWSSGKTTEKWDIPKEFLVLTDDPNGQPFVAMNGGLMGLATTVPFVQSDFQWIQPANLQEKDPISYHGKQCFHYKGMRTLPYGGGSSPPVPTPCEAWIDSKTLLPVALDTGTMLGTFTFQKRPPPPLVLPAKYQAKLDRYQMGMGYVKPGH